MFDRVRLVANSLFAIPENRADEESLGLDAIREVQPGGAVLRRRAHLGAL
ncbi:MAG: hypothetical protein O7I42_18035 [Alphaproteobacteria bacterium]|nr:hypothetical protein [Alphaproteobacteria bacterium]